MTIERDRVSLAAMLADDVEIEWMEAVAIVRELCAAPRTDDVIHGSIPLTPGKVWLDRDGGVSLSAGVTIAVRQLADLLEVLLLAPGRPRGRLPGPLVITLARALGQVDAPGFATPSAFDESLARFERTPRRELLQSLFARWSSVRPPESIAALPVRRERLLGTAWIALIAAGSMAAGSGLAFVMLRAPSPRALHSAAPPNAAADNAPPRVDAVPPPNEIDPPAKPSARNRQKPSRPQRLVNSTAVDANALFSPSFASTGGAVFFHALGPDGSALKRAEPGDGSGVLHVATIVDDGAKNYHVQLAPDGSAVAFDSDRDGERGVYTARPDGRAVTRVSGDGYSSVPKWSPDSRQLIFARAEPYSARIWNLWSLDLRSGLQRRLSSHAFGQTWPGAWFGDGRRVCYSHEDRLVVLDLATGRSRIYRSPVPGRLVRTPAVSPDGRWVMFQVFRDGGWLLDLSDGSMQRVLEDSSAEEFTWSPDGRRVAFHSRRGGQWGLWVMAPR
jgi:Tol biopolymer transport system component